MRSAKFIMNYILGITLITLMPIVAIRQVTVGYETVYPVLCSLSLGIGVGIIVWNLIAYASVKDEEYMLAKNELEEFLRHKRAEKAKEALKEKEE